MNRIPLRSALAVCLLSLGLAAPALVNAKQAPKNNLIKPVSVKVKAAPAALPSAKIKGAPAPVDTSEREIWRHQGVG